MIEITLVERDLPNLGTHLVGCVGEAIASLAKIGELIEVELAGGAEGVVRHELMAVRAELASAGAEASVFGQRANAIANRLQALVPKEEIDHDDAD